MGAQLIQLTSKCHHEHLLGSLQQFRLQGQLSDVTVQVDYQGDVQEFQAHQVMLAASSGYFKKILLSQEAARHKLLLPNMHFNDFSKFLEFVYTGKVEVARDKIGDVHAAAQFLDCGDLAEVCGEALSAGIQQTPTMKTSAPEAAEKEDSSGARKEKATKGRKQPRSLILKRRLSPQSAEKDVSQQANNTATGEKRLKLTLAGRKVLQRCLYIEGEDLKNENQVGREEAEEQESRTKAQSQAEIGAEQASDVHEWGCEEPEQSNDEDAQMVSQGVAGVEEVEEEEDVEGDEEGEEEEEEEEGEETAESKETAKKSSKFQFECNKCLRTFHYEKSYLKHISVYHGVKAEVINRCEICLQTFTNRSNLKIHEKHVHSTERLFSCSTCNKTFKRKKDVIRHQKQVHERSSLRHICTDCGKSLSSKTALLLHVRTHSGDRPYECKECGARFTQNSALKMHSRTHTGEKPFSCDECDARFTQKHMLTYHKRSHSGEKPFMCEACGKSFASKEYLRHHSNIHTGSKPYKCEQCGRGFAQRNSLHQHMKIHTGERPYSCKDCEKQFTQLNALQRHQRIHTGEKPYMCGLCGRTFTDKSTLRRHTMIHDSDAPWKTYLVMLEGNVEDKKPKPSPKGKTDKAGAEEKKSGSKRSSAAASTSTGAGKSGSPGKVQAEPIVAEPVTIPSDWAAHGAIALVSHGALGGITVIHTEVPPGAQIQPIVTTDASGAGVISLDGSAIPLPFSIPVSVASAIPVAPEAAVTSSAIPLAGPAPDGEPASDDHIQTVATSSVLEAAASQTILAPSGTETKESADIQTIVIDQEVIRKQHVTEEETADETQAQAKDPADQSV